MTVRGQSSPRPFTVCFAFRSCVFACTLFLSYFSLSSPLVAPPHLPSSPGAAAGLRLPVVLFSPRSRSRSVAVLFMLWPALRVLVDHLRGRLPPACICFASFAPRVIPFAAFVFFPLRVVYVCAFFLPVAVASLAFPRCLHSDGLRSLPPPPVSPS